MTYKSKSIFINHYIITAICRFSNIFQIITVPRIIDDLDAFFQKYFVLHDTVSCQKSVQLKYCIFFFYPFISNMSYAVFISVFLCLKEHLTRVLENEIEILDTVFWLNRKAVGKIKGIRKVNRCSFSCCAHLQKWLKKWLNLINR